MRNILFNLLIIILLAGCSSLKKTLDRKVAPLIGSKVFDHQHTGFLLLDAHTKDTLFERNGSKYFTPASNTKIFTLFASLASLPDKIPALKYVMANDTVRIMGTGDPTFLHPYFKDSTALRFLGGQNTISLYLNNFQDERYGPGWAWEDYQFYYQPERSGFPLYGNVTTIFKSDSLAVVPTYFWESTVELAYSGQREENRNLFYFDPTRKDTAEIPFLSDSTLTRKLLENALKKKVSITNQIPLGERSIVYGVPSDSVYRRMMLVSDNFLAEQLMLLVASTLSDTLSFEKAKDHVLENHLSMLRQSPNWVDGSGLSRYNLFTPQSMVQVLDLLHTRIPRERLFGFFPVGGVSGTLKSWYKGDPEPYIYAKSGSLGNTYCLSGYLITRSGKTLIFSFMNNNFIGPSSNIKEQMQAVFETIRDTY